MSNPDFKSLRYELREAELVEKRRKAVMLRAAGLDRAAIAERLGMSKSVITQWVRQQREQEKA